MNNYRKLTATIAATIMITALFASLGAAGATETSVTASPDKVKANTRVLLTFTVTNGTGENLDDILIRPETGTFTEAIGGQEAADNLVLAADNMENAVSPLQLAGENLILAEDNIVSSSTDFGDMNTYLQEPVQDDWLLAAGDFPQAGDNAWEFVETAGGELSKVSSAIDNEVLDLGYLKTHLTNAADNLNDAAGNPFDTPCINIDNFNSPAAENMQRAADNLEEAATALGSGNFVGAGENMLEASPMLENAGTKLAENDADLSAISDAASSLEAAGSKLSDAGDSINNASTPLKDAGKYLLSAGSYIESADDNLATAGNLIENAADNLKSAGDALGSNAPLQAGENLRESSDNLSDSASELGLVFGESSVATAATQENIAGDNLANDSSFGLSEAGDALKSMATDLSSAATKITDTANSFAPADWTLTEGTPNSDDAFFSGIQDNKIAPGASEDFTFVWKSGTSEATFEIWGYKEGAGIDSPTFGPKEVTVGVDSTKPGVSVTVTQEGVAENNIVGTTYDNGKATLKITATEKLDNIGPITIQDEDNLLPQITKSDLTTADDKVFTYEFDVGEWDDNSLVEVSIDSAKDPYGNENTSLDNGEFYVDTRAPVIIDNAIRVSEDLDLETKIQAGSGHAYLVDNSAAAKTLTGRVEDNWTAGTRLDYENVSMPEVITVDILWDGESVTAPPTPADNFSEDITLPEGPTSKLTVKATDWTGNSTSDELDNVFIDTTAPSVSFDTVAGESWTKDEQLINDDTPTINLTISDSGLGVYKDNLVVQLDNDDNFKNGAGTPGWTLDNANPYEWDAAAGKATFENTIDNSGNGLVDGTYWITGRASDNLRHNSGENYVFFAKSFKIDATAPDDQKTYINRNTVTVQEADGTPLVTEGSQTATGTTDESSLTVSGTCIEDGSTIKVYAGKDGTEVGSVTETKNDGDHLWSMEITGLSEGINELYLEETDEAGNASTKVLFGTITVDQTPPTISLSSDTQALDETSTDKTSVTLSATITDSVADYKGIGVAIRADAYDRPQTTVSLNSDDTLTVGVPLQKGSNTIDIVASDSVGNTTIKSISVERTVTPWTMYAAIAAIIAIILAAIAVLRRS